jgi:plasmid stabilization system protein ParE
VPVRHKIGFAESAIADLEVPEVGERLLREVVLQVERLAGCPESGRVVPEFGIAPLREIIHPPFRIVYRLDAGRVRIVRVWRSERLLKMP